MLLLLSFRLLLLLLLLLLQSFQSLSLLQQPLPLIEVVVGLLDLGDLDEAVEALALGQLWGLVVDLWGEEALQGEMGLAAFASPDEREVDLVVRFAVLAAEKVNYALLIYIKAPNVVSLT